MFGHAKPLHDPHHNEWYDLPPVRPSEVYVLADEIVLTMPDGSEFIGSLSVGGRRDAFAVIDTETGKIIRFEARSRRAIPARGHNDDGIPVEVSPPVRALYDAWLSTTEGQRAYQSAMDDAMEAA